MMRDNVSHRSRYPGINRVLGPRAAFSGGHLLCWGRLDRLYNLAARNPKYALVIDHLGLQAAIRATGAAAAVCRASKGAGAGSPRQCHHQDQRRLCTLSHEPFPV